MSEKVILTVSEGPSDIGLMSALIERAAQDAGVEVTVRSIAPKLDQTTQTYPAHGWSKVRQWCKSYSEIKPAGDDPLARAARRKTIPSLLALADYLFIQIDTDIAEEISDAPKPFDPNVDCRKAFTKASILRWLGRRDEPDKTFLVLSTYSIENWILASFPSNNPVIEDLPEHHNYEEVKDAEQRLARTGIFRTKRKNGIRKIVKKEGEYRIVAQRIAKDIEIVKERCHEFKRFNDKVNEVIS